MLFSDIILSMKTAQILTIEDLQNENAFLKEQIACLKEQIEWLKKQIFGKKSEKEKDLSNEWQTNIFDFLDIKEEPIIEQKGTISAHERRKPNRNEQDKISLPEDLPIETIVLDVPEEQKNCRTTGQPLVKIGEEVTQKLVHKPGSYYIKKIIRPKYVNRNEEEAGIVIAELPDGIIPKCRADESFLAEVITKKFADHLPLYRISEILEREGIGISRKLLSQWIVKCGMALMPLYDEMLKKILESGNIFIDESPVDVQDTGGVKTGYMWVVVGGGGGNPVYRIYNFCMDRCHDNAIKILTTYNRVLHSDKYGAYQKLAEKKQIEWCPCWAHIRRKFFEAEAGDAEFRKWVLRKIRYLFMLEKIAWARSAEERLKIRQDKEVPIIDELIEKIKQKLSDAKILPKSNLGKAVRYFCGLIPYLKTYTKHSNARLDNNVAERAVRPLTIGRKNWMFFGSKQGGESGAVLLSLVQTCRGLEINPREYLEDIFRKIMGYNSQKLHELLPDQWLANRKKMQ